MLQPDGFFLMDESLIRVLRLWHMFSFHEMVHILEHHQYRLQGTLFLYYNQQPCKMVIYQVLIGIFLTIK